MPPNASVIRGRSFPDRLEADTLLCVTRAHLIQILLLCWQSLLCIGSVRNWATVGNRRVNNNDQTNMPERIRANGQPSANQTRGSLAANLRYGKTNVERKRHLQSRRNYNPSSSATASTVRIHQSRAIAAQSNSTIVANAPCQPASSSSRLPNECGTLSHQKPFRYCGRNLSIRCLVDSARHNFDQPTDKTGARPSSRNGIDTEQNDERAKSDLVNTIRHQQSRINQRQFDRIESGRPLTNSDNTSGANGRRGRRSLPYTS